MDTGCIFYTLQKKKKKVKRETSLNLELNYLMGRQEEAAFHKPPPPRH